MYTNKRVSTQVYDTWTQALYNKSTLFVDFGVQKLHG